MLRWMLPLAAVVIIFNPAEAADLAASDGVIYGKEPRHGRVVAVEKDSDLLFTPSEAMPYIRLPPRTPILLGSATLPGYYGSTHSYEYQGPYYGGPNINFRAQLPYACGVLGYC
jgi:hypothetical protein